MSMPKDSILKKPKHVAHIGRQKVLYKNIFVMEGPFFLLSIHPSQLDDSPYGYTGHVTRNIHVESSGFFDMAAILTALCYVMLHYVHFANKHKIYGADNHN
jgi:hypothetical protein